LSVRLIIAYAEIVKSLVKIFLWPLMHTCLNIPMPLFGVHFLPGAAQSSLGLRECPSIP